jgi:hypothetical protein
LFVLSSIEIQRFRGIQEGKLSDLTPLVVLVGPNGSGKSTILEAMLVGASPLVVESLIQVIGRHEAGGSSPRWILWRAGQQEGGHITVSGGGIYRTVAISLDRTTSDDVVYLDIRMEFPGGAGQVRWNSRGTPRIVHSPIGFHSFNALREVELIEPFTTSPEKPLYKLYTRAAEHGRRDDALRIVQQVFRCTDMEILTENDAPILHLYPGSYPVPATLCGDGIVSLLRLGLELAASAGGLALLEEPETHQHPAAIRQSAKVILAGLHRGMQIVLSTHSLELIDGLLAEASDVDLARFSLYRVQLENGTLQWSRHAGAEARFARRQIEEDLR